MQRLRRVRDHVANPGAGGDDTDVDVEAAINAAWVLLCTALVLWEQAGFAMWEAGCLRSKPTPETLRFKRVGLAISTPQRRLT